MQKKCNGFSLIEVMISFSLVLIVSSTCIVLFVNVYQQRMTVKQIAYAYELLQNEINHYHYDPVHWMEKEQDTELGRFIVSKEKGGHGYQKLCVTVAESKKSQCGLIYEKEMNQE